MIELLDGEFARAGYEIDRRSVDAAARPPRITVVADGDDPPDLDAIAAVVPLRVGTLDTLADIADVTFWKSPHRASTVR